MTCVYDRFLLLVGNFFQEKRIHQLIQLSSKSSLNMKTARFSVNFVFIYLLVIVMLAVLVIFSTFRSISK